MTPCRAHKTVAAHLAAVAADRLSSDGWEEVPEIGEGDWLAISNRLTILAEKLEPHPADLEEALDFLEQRADKES